MAYSSKHPKFDDVIFKDNGLGGSVPNPATGSDKIVNRGGNFFSRSSTGAERPLGGSTGEINVFTDTDGIGATWVASGGGVTVANTTTAADIALYPIKTTAILLTNVSGTDYMRGRFTMPLGLQNKKLKWEFFQEALSGYVDGDNKIEVWTNTASNYGGTYAELPLSTDDSSGDSFLPNLTGKYTTYFDSDDLLYYEVRVVRVAGTAAITFGGVVLGPGIQPQGAVVGDWIAYTPSTTGMGTVASTQAWYRRVGDSIEVQGQIKAGTPTATALTVALPTGLTFDPSKEAGDSANLSGVAVVTTGSAAGVYTVNVGLMPFIQSGDYSSIFFARQNGLDGGSGALGAAVNGSAVLSATSLIGFRFMGAIAGWTGSGTLNIAENAVEYVFNTDLANANDLTSFGYGPQGTQFGNYSGGGPTKRVQFVSPIQVGDKIDLEISNDSGHTWLTDNGVVVSSYQVQTGTGYGMQWDTVAGNDTQLDVSFGNHRLANAAIFGGAGSNWSDIDNDPVFLWRIKKVSQSGALGFSQASINATGLAPKGVFSLTEDSVVDLQPRSANPSNPTSSSDVKVYVKGSLYILMYNDGGTVRFKYLDMAGTGVTWVHTTTPP